MSTEQKPPSKPRTRYTAAYIRDMCLEDERIHDEALARGATVIWDEKLRAPRVIEPEPPKMSDEDWFRARGISVVDGTMGDSTYDGPSSDEENWRRDAEGETQANHDTGRVSGGTTPAPDPWEQALAQALKDVTNTLGSTVSKDRRPLFMDAATLFSQDFGETPWQVTGLFTRGGLAQFGAEPKSGKTWLMLEAAVAIVTGTKVCGEFYAQQGVVAYFFAEDLARQVRNRTRALLAGRGLNESALGGRLHVQPRGVTLDICRDEDLAWVVASARQFGKIDLLVLDPLRDLHSGKENDSDDMSDVMRRMKALGTLLDCTVAFAHHKGKPTKDSVERRPGAQARGSSAIHGSTDSGVYFGLRGGDGRKLLELAVDVEIKGAAGAGKFRLKLGVEDDEKGEAKKAVWEYSKPTAADIAAANEALAGGAKGAKASKPTKELSAEDKMLANTLFMWIRDLVISGERNTRRKLRSHNARPANIPTTKIYELVDWLINEGRLRLDSEGVILLPEPPSDERYP